MAPDVLSAGSVDEAVRRRFEAAWRDGAPGPIEDYLPAADHPLYSTTLEELVLIELELAWKAKGSTGRSDGPRVEEYLARFPALHQPETILRLMRQEYLARHRYGDQPGMPEYRARFPDLAPTGTDLRTPDWSPGSGGHARPPAVPGYELLEELGRGGMGVVYKARQVGLNRLAALKWVRYADASAEDLARFRTEAEAAARLQHPHIVQVFEVGEAAGRPFLALEYVPGGPLSRFLAGTPQPPRLAAGLVEQVARAVQYAHDRGVVHRDLKPANILLTAPIGPIGPMGPIGLIPKVADFGLAKVLETDSGQTHTGAILGTPSYMAPEQAAGRKDVGPAADVWALGAILYECLTGRPPFRGESRGDTLQQVVASDPVPPSRLQPKTTRDLDTVCLKCLERAPDRRYPSAAALADDLGRYLRGEPIRARPVGTPERVWRWARRNPRDAGLIAALFLVLAGGLAAATSLWALAERRRHAAERAEEAARKERDAADEASRLARAAVRESLTLAAEDPAFHLDGMAPARRRLQETALRYFREFTARRGGDPALQAEVADAHHRVGRIAATLATQAEAEAELEKARAIYARLAEEHPADPFPRDRLAKVLRDIGRRRDATGRVGEAASLYGQALTIQRELVAAEPGDPGRRLDLADTELAVVANHFQAGKYRDTLAALGPCQDDLAAVGPAGPADRVRWLSGSALSLAAQAHWRLGDLAAAEAAARAAIDRFEEGLRADPTPGGRQELARSYGVLGLILSDRKRPADHLACYRKATELRERSAELNPTVHDYQVDLGISYRGLADALEETGQAAAAREYRQKALAPARRAVDGDPTVVQAWRGLAFAHWDLYLDYRRWSAPPPALERAAGAVTVHGMPVVRLALAARQEAHLTTARAHLAEAQAAFERAAALSGLATDADRVAACHMGWAELARNARDWPAARAAYGAARRMYEDLVRAEPDRPEFRQQLPRIDTNLAYICQETGDLDGMFRLKADVLRARRELADKYPTGPNVRADLARTRAELAGVAARFLRYALDPEVPPEVARRRAAEVRPQLGAVLAADPDNPDLKAAVGKLDAFLAAAPGGP